MKSIVENKKITKCIVADIFHWDFSGGEGWDACLLLVIKRLGDVGILDSALEEGGFGQKHPPAIFLLACLPAPLLILCSWSLGHFPHSDALYSISVSSLSVYSCSKRRPICFWADLLSAPNCFGSSQFWCQTLLNSQKKTLGKACSSMSSSSLESLGKLIPPPPQTWTKVSIFLRVNSAPGAEAVLLCGR